MAAEAATRPTTHAPRRPRNGAHDASGAGRQHLGRADTAHGFECVPQAAQDWAVCSDRLRGAAGSFQPRNAGLAITELTFLGQWPTTDAASFAGCQDNGTVRLRGEPTWFESPRGDGGGITVDPNNPYRVIRTPDIGIVGWKDMSIHRGKGSMFTTG